MAKKNWIRNKIYHLLFLLGREISGFINGHSCETNKKSILLFCQSQTMEEHLLNYMEQLEDEPIYHFYLYFGEGYPDKEKHDRQKTMFKDKEIETIRNLWKLYVKKWSLIVCPDMDYPFWVKRGTIPIIYIGHGSGGISYDGGEHSYDYSDASLDANGKPAFDIMLEPNRETASFMKKDPVYGKVIRCGGYRFAYKIKEASLKQAFYRKQLGISDKKIVVSIWGSWNKDSLFHVLGEKLFDVCNKLKNEKYEFIFSIHPREYQKYDDDLQPLGDAVEAQRENGFLVRSPGEDWLPYMMASDIVLVDYSSMLSLAVLAGKKVILSDFPDERLWKKSMYYEIKKTFPVLHQAEELGNVLKLMEESEYYKKEIQRFQEQLYASREEYKKFIKSVTEELVISKERK